MVVEDMVEDIAAVTAAFLASEIEKLKRLQEGAGGGGYPSYGVVARVLSMLFWIDISAYNTSLSQVDATDEWDGESIGIPDYPKSFGRRCALYHHVSNEPFALVKGVTGNKPNHWLYLQHASSMNGGECYASTHTSIDHGIAYDGTALSLRKIKRAIGEEKKMGRARGCKV